MKILFLSRWFPYPPDNGSKIRIYNLLRQMADRHSVDLISFTSEPISAEQRSGLEGICRRVDSVPYRAFRPGRLQAVFGFFALKPRSLVDTHSPEMEKLVQLAARNQEYDAVIASQIDMAPYAAAVQGIPTRIFEEIELTTLYEGFTAQKGLGRRMRGALTWGKLSFYLPRLVSRFDGCTVVSAGERQRLLSAAPRVKSVAVIPNGVDLERMTGDFGSPKADTLIYNGSITYAANFDAVKYFLEAVFPLILKERPWVRLQVTGNTGGVRLDDLPCRDQVDFSGYLPDVRPSVASAWVSLAPLRIGGGTRLKILESLALGTPVVATSKGAEGLELSPGRDFLQADTPYELARAVLSLLNDPGLRAKLASAGRTAVEQRYDWKFIGQQFNTFLEQVAHSSVQ